MDAVQQIPMKRWNQKGSVHAKRRMSEVRQAGRDHVKSDLIWQWSQITGRPAREWWDDARAAGLIAGCGTEASIAFLRSAIAQHKPNSEG